MSDLLTPAGLADGLGDPPTPSGVANGPPVGQPGSSGKQGRRDKSQSRTAWLFLLPNLLGFLVFLAGPLVFSLAMAFTNWDLREKVPLEFVGLRNFRDLLNSNDFWAYFINTLYFMLGIPLSIAGSLGLALLLNKPLKENSLVGRLVHAGLVLLSVVVIGAAMYGYGTINDSMAARIGGGLALLAGSIWALAVFTGIVTYRTLYYLPTFTSGVAAFILWKALYNTQTGPINAGLDWLLSGGWWGLNNMLGWVGVGPWSPPQWLASTQNLFALNPEKPGFVASQFGLGARDALVIMGVVTSIGGGNMLLYLAGLSNVPQDLYEAADIDGASGWQRFWNVTWPQLAPTTFFIVVMSTIGGLQGGFDQAKVMTAGGPAGTTTTLSYFIYSKAFEQFRMGYASAVAWVLFLIVFVVTAVNWRFGNRQLND